MQYKIVTHANNDVYTDTRKKITLADSELKKSWYVSLSQLFVLKGRIVHLEKKF